MIDSVFRVGILLAISVLAFGCQPPVEPPVEPMNVRPSDLARSYQEQPQQAAQAYNNYEIVVPLDSYKADDHQIYWYAGADIYPPTIVFAFVEPITPPRGPIWVRGRCLGKTSDNINRDSTIKLTITVRDCQLVQPARQQGQLP